MAFIRIKMVKGRPYSYLVENYREGGKVRQRVLKYLGAGDKRSTSTKAKLGTTGKKNIDIEEALKTEKLTEKLQTGKELTPKENRLIQNFIERNYAYELEEMGKKADEKATTLGNDPDLQRRVKANANFYKELAKIAKEDERNRIRKKGKPIWHAKKR